MLESSGIITGISTLLRFSIGTWRVVIFLFVLFVRWNFVQILETQTKRDHGASTAVSLTKPKMNRSQKEKREMRTRWNRNISLSIFKEGCFHYLQLKLMQNSVWCINFAFLHRERKGNSLLTFWEKWGFFLYIKCRNQFPVLLLLIL